MRMKFSHENYMISYEIICNHMRLFQPGIFETEIQPQYARDLIQKMLADQPEQRITSSVVTQELEQQAEVNIKYYKNLSHILLI